MSQIKKGVLYYDKVKVEYQYGIINKKSNFVITGYYWGHFNINRNSRDKMTYGQLAQRLVNSCVKNNCNYFIGNIEEFAKPGGYQQGINYKTTFLLNTLKFIYPRAAINLDTDMCVDKYPNLFDIEGIDYWGFNWYQEPRSVAGYFPIDCYDPYVLRTSGGIMGVANSQPALQFLKQWDDLMKHPKMIGKAEDVIISVEFAINNWITKLRCLWLPVEMFSIPYFYDHDDYWYIEKKYQKIFPHIKFKGDESINEYTFDKIYKIKKDGYYISHPEALTDEEVAAQQGASNNRVPDEYLIETGKKLRCLTKTGKLCNIPSLYCDTKDQEKALSGLNKSLDALQWNILEKMPKILNKCKFKILVDSVNTDSYLYIFSGNHPEDLRGFKGNYLVIEIYEKCYKSFIIFQILKKYTKVRGIIFLENCLNCMDAIKLENNPELEYCDFGCINGNSREVPCYKKNIIEPCYDVRALNAITTDILYFKNNKYGKNILTLWNYCSGGYISRRKNSSRKKIDDRHALSIAFNKYGCIVFTRVLWFHPSYFCPDSQNIFKKPINDPLLIFDSFVKSLNNIDLYDYFKQCGNKPKIPGFSNIMSKDTHYHDSKFKK